MKAKKIIARKKSVLRLKNFLPKFRVNEGSELEPINLNEYMRNKTKKQIVFGATLEGGAPLPNDIVCMPDGVFGGKAAVGTSKPTPYRLEFTAQVPNEEPFIFRTTLNVYVRTKDTDIAEYNNEKMRKFKVQEIMRKSFMHIGPTAYPMEPVLSEAMALGIEVGMGYGRGALGPVHPILGKAAQFSGDFKEENANPSENSRPEIQNKLQLIQRPEFRPGIAPTPTATKPM